MLIFFFRLVVLWSMSLTVELLNGLVLEYIG